MLTVRRSAERGQADHGWLRSFHSFSFADYHDPAHVQFGPLRVINEDRVAPGGGFDTHGHRDMEIVSYVLDGALAHRDSLGTGSTIRPGDVQRMTAGTGVLHSEFNADPGAELHFLQIWLLPERRGLEPSYEQRHFPESEKRGRLRLIASRDGVDGSVTVHQDARLYAGLFDDGEVAELEIEPGRLGYVHVARGTIRVNDTELSAGDALLLEDERRVSLARGTGAEVLVFDLPGDLQ
jgi:redox-sensitive bicupin YhaK (pirin superfamily)